MALSKTFIVLSIFSLFVSAALAKKGKSSKHSWCYVKKDCNQDNSKSAWQKGTCKSGRLQSPIDIPEKYYLSALAGDTEFQFYSEDYVMSSFKMSNDGKRTELSSLKAKTRSKPTIRFGDRGHYLLEKIQLHWGSKDREGSEHTLAGKPYSGEITLLHYKDTYKDYDSANKSGDAGSLANFAIVLEADNNGEDVVSPALKPFFDNLSKIANKGKSASVEGTLDISALIKTQDYLAAYDGSITTPPCAETVQWFVGLKPVGITSDSIKKLRTTIKGVDKKSLTSNFRKIQPTNGRTVGRIEIKQK